VSGHGELSPKYRPPYPIIWCRFTGQLRLAVAACLARFKGSSRESTASDLRCYLAWCGQRALDLRRHPLGSLRPGRYRDVVRAGPQ